jgi:glycosyltransferase involved in cell wall biosynthesis
MDVVRVAYSLEQCWHDVPGGTAVAAIEVARAMRDARPDVQLCAVAGRHDAVPGARWAPPLEVHGLPLAGGLLYEAMLRTGRPRVERATGAVEVAHSTTIIPFPSHAPLVVTVHDLAFLRHPEFFTARGNDVFRRALAVVRRRAALVVCSSAATMRDCVEAGIPASRCRVVHLGTRRLDVRGTHVRGLGAGPPRAGGASRGEDLLFVGTLEPRKNLGRLLTALDRLGADAPRLRVAGAPGWGRALEGLDETVRGRVAHRVEWLGEVSEARLAELYDAAAAVCVPSVREGFGLPILEAMAHGAPVVTSRGSSTEEVAAGAAVLVDPLDPDAIAAGIREALTRRDELSRAGRARAAEMTWERAATRTAAVYDEVAT